MHVDVARHACMFDRAWTRLQHALCMRGQQPYRLQHDVAPGAGSRTWVRCACSCRGSTGGASTRTGRASTFGSSWACPAAQRTCSPRRAPSSRRHEPRLRRNTHVPAAPLPHRGEPCRWPPATAAPVAPAGNWGMRRRGGVGLRSVMMPGAGRRRRRAAAQPGRSGHSSSARRAGMRWRPMNARCDLCVCWSKETWSAKAASAAARGPVPRTSTIRPQRCAAEHPIVSFV